MVSPKVVQERGGELERNAKGAGTGPFEFVEWVRDDHLLIKRNDGYWNKQGGPYLDRVRYRPIPDDTVKLQSLQAGEIDVIDYVQPRDVAAVKADKNLVVVDVPSLADFAYQLQPPQAALQQQAAAPGGGLRAGPRPDRQGRVAQRRGAGQRADPADELGVRQVDRADQARPGQGQGQAGRGRQGRAASASR